MNDPENKPPLESPKHDIDDDDVAEIMPEGTIKPNANNNNNNNIEGHPPPRPF